MVLDVPNQRGHLHVDTGCMYSGKSESLVNKVIKLKHSPYSAITIMSSLSQARDGRILRAKSGTEIIPDAILEPHESEMILEIIKEKQPDVVAIDECNFYDRKLIPTIEKILNQNIAVLGAGLIQDFRGEVFGPMGIIVSMANNVKYPPAYCAIVNKGKQCGKPAHYTVRLVKDKNGEIGFRKMINGEDEIFEKGYRFAPYYDPTVSPANDNRFTENREYSTACRNCFKLPMKDETRLIQTYIYNQSPLRRDLILKEFSNIKPIEDILNFLIKEKRIKEQEGILQPQNYFFDVESRTYIPKE